MHVILTGATGLVGSAALHAMLRNPTITRITIFSRKAVEQAADTEEAKRKCSVLIHDDFSGPPSQAELASLHDARGCLWALGISVNAVDATLYERITVTWPLAWAKAFATAGLGSAAKDGDGLFNFVYVSGEGATTRPSLFTPRFARVKGQAEQALLDLAKEPGCAKLKVFSARPGAVDRVGHSEITKYTEGREGYQQKLEKPIRAILRPLWKDMMSPTPALGDALLRLAVGDGQPQPHGPGIEGDGRILGNVALRRLGGL